MTRFFTAQESDLAEFSLFLSSRTKLMIDGDFCPARVLPQPHLSLIAIGYLYWPRMFVSVNLKQATILKLAGEHVNESIHSR